MFLRPAVSTPTEGSALIGSPGSSTSHGTADLPRSLDSLKAPPLPGTLGSPDSLPARRSSRRRPSMGTIDEASGTDIILAQSEVSAGSMRYLNPLRSSAVRLSTAGPRGTFGEGEVVAEGASVTASTINMLNTILGTGLLALPTVFGHAGFVTGTLIVIIFGTLSVFTNAIFVECALRFGRPTSFTVIANRVMPGASIAIDLAVLLNSLGTSISYIIVATDGFVHVFGGLWTLLAMAIAVPLAFLRNMDSLRVTSLLAVISIAYITVVIIVHLIGASGPPDSSISPCPSVGASPESCPAGERVAVGTLMGNLGASASLGLAFGAIYSTPPIFNEIVTPTRATMLQVAGVAFGAATCLYIVVGVCGYATYGDKVDANILNSYPHTPMVSVARIALSFVTIFSFPIQILVCRISATACVQYFGECCRSRKKELSGAEPSTLDAPFASAEEGGASSRFSKTPSGKTEPKLPPNCCAALFTTELSGIIITAVLVLPALILGLVLKDVSVVFNLTGAIGGSLVIFVFPGLMYASIFRECTWVRGMAVFCVCLGAVLLVLGVTTTLLHT